MSDRSEEVTRSRDSATTEELLEETESILSGSSSTSGIESSGTEGDRESDGEETTNSDTSWLPSIPSPSIPGLSPTRYFSPRAYLAFVLVVGAGLLAGGTTIPIAGRMIGVFAAAFFLGVVTSKRRYLEMSAAGFSVGVAAASFNYAVFVLAGTGETLLAVGTTAGLLASLLGYYFGRDLKNGLTRDVK